MVNQFYKKTGILTNYLAREFLSSEVGDKCPTIAYCTETFHVSRGTIQDAMAILENSGCITTEKMRKRGTILTGLDKEKLFQMSGIDTITGTMPLPLTLELQGLASGVCMSMESSPAPFAFAFVQGSSKRVRLLVRMAYDFTIVSRSTAKRLLPENPELEIIAALPGTIYSKKYALYVSEAKGGELRDGLVIASDPLCTDQTSLLHAMTKDFSICHIDTPYSTQRALLLEGGCDAILQQEHPEMESSPVCRSVPVPEELYDYSDLTTPVILGNKNNHGIDRLLGHFLDAAKISNIQSAILDKKMRPRFY